MAKKSAKTTKKKTTNKSKPAKKKGPATGSARMTYPEAMKKKVVAAIRKGMTHLEASQTFQVGVHSIPNWLKKHGK